MQAIHGSGYWALSKDDAMKITVAAKNVARHYPLLADEKMRDWYVFGAIMFTIEGKKLLNMRKPRAEQAPAQPMRVEPAAQTGADPWAGLIPDSLRQPGEPVL